MFFNFSFQILSKIRCTHPIPSPTLTLLAHKIVTSLYSLCYLSISISDRHLPTPAIPHTARAQNCYPFPLYHFSIRFLSLSTAQSPIVTHQLHPPLGETIHHLSLSQSVVDQHTRSVLTVSLALPMAIVIARPFIPLEAPRPGSSFRT